MGNDETELFLSGVVEGFYGQPWAQAERLELFQWMEAWGLNTYLYAPKNDLKHRTIWREPYSASETPALRELIQTCRQRGLRFIYGLSPGLDIRYQDKAELDQLRKRFDQMLGLDCQHFALLFDDLPDPFGPDEVGRWISLASAQCQVTNTLFRWTRERRANARFLFCPTPYCGRMAEHTPGAQDYLLTVGRELAPEIEVFWTGPEIISREIPLEHIQKVSAVLGRKPLLWDNLHANDYDGRRFYCGPYAGRPRELRQAVKGVLLNPNNEFLLNYAPLRTLADFLSGAAPAEWNPRKAYLAALQEWLPRFATTGRPLALEDLILFCDCYYLPYEEGPEAETLYQRAQALLTEQAGPAPDQLAAFRREAARLREFCLRMSELRDRPLFYALSRRIWELREELDLIERCLAIKFDRRHPEAPWRSDFHLPGTYRGGMVARLQRLLVPQAGGTFKPIGEQETRSLDDEPRTPIGTAR